MTYVEWEVGGGPGDEEFLLKGFVVDNLAS